MKKQCSLDSVISYIIIVTFVFFVLAVLCIEGLHYLENKEFNSVTLRKCNLEVDRVAQKNKHLAGDLAFFVEIILKF